MSEQSPVPIIVSGYATAPEAAGFRISTTRPDCLFRHDISDEELIMLTNANNDGFKDAMWASLGAAISASPSALDYGYEYVRDPNHHLGAPGFITLVVFVASIAVYVCMFFVCKDKKTSAKILSEAIRARSPKQEENPKIDRLMDPTKSQA